MALAPRCTVVYFRMHECDDDLEDTDDEEPSCRWADMRDAILELQEAPANESEVHADVTSRDLTCDKLFDAPVRASKSIEFADAGVLA